jgi:hypothetical protein
MPDEDFHLADHARSQAHDSGFRRNDAALARGGHAARQPTHFLESGRDDFAVALPAKPVRA